MTMRPNLAPAHVTAMAAGIAQRSATNVMQFRIDTGINRP